MSNLIFHVRELYKLFVSSILDNIRRLDSLTVHIVFPIAHIKMKTSMNYAILIKMRELQLFLKLIMHFKFVLLLFNFSIRF